MKLESFAEKRKHRRHLRLVVSNDAPASTDALYSKYIAAQAAWQAEKTEQARVKARDAYNAWASAFCGPTDAAAVLITKDQAWGFN